MKLKLTVEIEVATADFDDPGAIAEAVESHIDVYCEDIDATEHTMPINVLKTRVMKMESIDIEGMEPRNETWIRAEP